jgi:hypothetical protein
MDQFTERLICETVPVVVRVLGVPPETAELAVRHAFTCSETPCVVYQFLMDRVNETTEARSGVPRESIENLLESTGKSWMDTLAMRHRLGVPIGPDQLQESYDHSLAAMDAGMDLLREKR